MSDEERLERIARAVAELWIPGEMAMTDYRETAQRALVRLLEAPPGPDLYADSECRWHYQQAVNDLYETVIAYRRFAPNVEWIRRLLGGRMP